MAKKKKKRSKAKEVSGPNMYPEAISPEQKAAAAARCKFLGEHFDEGETICYDGFEWVCSAGTWDKTGNRC